MSPYCGHAFCRTCAIEMQDEDAHCHHLACQKPLDLVLNSLLKPTAKGHKRSDASQAFVTPKTGTARIGDDCIICKKSYETKAEIYPHAIMSKKYCCSKECSGASIPVCDGCDGLLNGGDGTGGHILRSKKTQKVWCTLCLEKLQDLKPKPHGLSVAIKKFQQYKSDSKKVDKKRDRKANTSESSKRCKKEKESVHAAGAEEFMNVSVEEPMNAAVEESMSASAAEGVD